MGGDDLYSQGMSADLVQSVLLMLLCVSSRLTIRKILYITINSIPQFLVAGPALYQLNHETKAIQMVHTNSIASMHVFCCFQYMWTDLFDFKECPRWPKYKYILTHDVNYLPVLL